MAAAVRLSVTVPDPFDWQRTIAYPQQAFPHPLYRIAGDRLQRVLWLGRVPWQLTLGPAIRRDSRWQLLVAGVPLGGGRSTGDDPTVVLAAAARHIVSADHDLAAMVVAVASDPIMAALAEQFRGVRLLRLANVYEGLADGIIGQQISVRAAHSIRQRLMKALQPGNGEPRLAAKAAVHADPEPKDRPPTEPPLLPFPHPTTVAAVPLAALGASGLVGRRAEYLAGVAAMAVDGDLPGPELTRLPLQEAMARLTAIRGVGRWTAELALLFGVGRTDVWPAGDLGLQDAIARNYQLAHRPSEGEVRKLARAWAPWAGYAAYYLWGARRASN